jgi:hypothetical protein
MDPLVYFLEKVSHAIPFSWSASRERRGLAVSEEEYTSMSKRKEPQVDILYSTDRYKVICAHSVQIQ